MKSPLADSLARNGLSIVAFAKSDVTYETLGYESQTNRASPILSNSVRQSMICHNRSYNYDVNMTWSNSMPSIRFGMIDSLRLTFHLALPGVE